MGISVLPAKVLPPAGNLNTADTARTTTEATIIVRVLQTCAELEEFRGTWKSWCTEPSADIDFFDMAVKYRAEIVSPYVVVVFRGGRPDCMLLGFLKQQRMDQKVGYVTIRRPAVRLLSLVYGGFLGNQSGENSRLLARHVSDFLKQGGADCASFSDLRADSPLRTALSESVGVFFQQHLFATQRHSALQLPGSFDDFMAQLSRKGRHELRRHTRMLYRDFPDGVRISCIRHESEIETLLNVVDQISRKTYQRALGTGFKCSLEMREQLRIAAAAGTLRACVLYVAERPCAFFIGNQYKSTFFGQYTGYDPEFARYSPGMFLLLHCIEESFDIATPAARFDLGWGDHSYKRVVCNLEWQEGPLYVYAPTLRGFVLNLQMSTIGLIDAGLRRLVTHSKLFQRLKKQWQRHAAQNFQPSTHEPDFPTCSVNEQSNI